MDFLLGTEDAAAVRFGISAPYEVGRAVVVLQRPQAHPLQWGWLRQTRERVPAEAVRLLDDVIVPGVYTPDFLTPAPTSSAAPAEQIQSLAYTPIEQVTRDLRKAAGYQTVPRRQRVMELLEDPVRARSAITAAYAQVWRCLIEPLWPQLEQALQADLALRSRQLVASGTGAVLRSLHERVTWDCGVVQVRTQRYERVVDCRGQGLQLVPSVFTWPGCAVLTEPPHAPTIFYPAHGVTEAWPAGRQDRREALAALMSDGRARILLALDSPMTSGQVAAVTRLRAPTVSRHLEILRSAGLIASLRQGRWVRHWRTATGHALATGTPSHEGVS